MKNNNVLIYAAALSLLAFAACSGDVKEANANGEFTGELVGEELEYSEVAIRFINGKAPNGMLRSVGDSVTWSNGEEILFTSYSMVDGAGYEWNTGGKGSLTNMPDWSKTLAPKWLFFFYGASKKI
jgi:hypothetical protein